jgi:hypothetical protein
MMVPIRMAGTMMMIIISGQRRTVPWFGWRDKKLLIQAEHDRSKNSPQQRGREWAIQPAQE